MFIKRKMSATTFGKDRAREASEKKEKEKIAKGQFLKKINVKKALHIIGYVSAALFIVIAIKQSGKAIMSVNAADRLYNIQMVKMLEEQEKAREALENQLNININVDGDIIKNDDTSDSNPVVIDADKDGNKYYMDENGNIILVDGNGNVTVYYICTTCSNCGGCSYGSICPKCHSNVCQYTIYEVKKGDTLSKISGKVGASVDSIAHLNEIDNVNLIYAGESLRIPK